MSRWRGTGTATVRPASATSPPPAGPGTSATPTPPRPPTSRSCSAPTATSPSPVTGTTTAPSPSATSGPPPAPGTSATPTAPAPPTSPSPSPAPHRAPKPSPRTGTATRPPASAGAPPPATSTSATATPPVARHPVDRPSTPAGTAVAGDWTGTGTASVGTFTAGTWTLHDPSSTPTDHHLRRVRPDHLGDQPDGPNEHHDLGQPRPAPGHRRPGRAVDLQDLRPGLRTAHRHLRPSPVELLHNDALHTANLSCTTPPVPHTQTYYDGGIHGLAGRLLPQHPPAPAPHRPCQTAFGTSSLYGYWPSGPPAAGLTTGTWSARYTGEIQLPDLGNYSFSTGAESGVRVWIDDTQIINMPADPGNGIVYSPAATYNRPAPRTTGTGSAWSSTNPATPPASNTVAGVALATPRPGPAPTTSSAGSVLGPRYGLETKTMTEEPDRHDRGSASPRPATYNNPETGLATATIDGHGGALTTETDYEPASTGTYFRRTARRLPAVAGTAGQTTTYAYYGAPKPPSTRAGPATPQSREASSRPPPTPPPPPARPSCRSRCTTPPDGSSPSQIQGDGAGWTCTTYDTRGRVTTQTTPAYGGYAARTEAHDYAVGGNPLITAVVRQQRPGSPTPIAIGACAGKNGVSPNRLTSSAGSCQLHRRMGQDHHHQLRPHRPADHDRRAPRHPRHLLRHGRPSPRADPRRDKALRRPPMTPPVGSTPVSYSNGTSMASHQRHHRGPRQPRSSGQARLAIRRQ